MNIVEIIYALLGISLIIFIHEAGHFLAAKRVGVRVERFAIGFDPPVRGRHLRFLCFRRGDTEYVLGMIPFGGYVKLAGGEMMLETGKAFAPDELPGKPVGARALVFVAGSVMNVLSALVFFMIAFSLGVPFLESKVGVVRPSSPAWKAGVRSGDRIVRLDGKEVTDFTEVRVGVALSRSDRPITLTVERETGTGGVELKDLSLMPDWDESSGFREIGIQPAVSGTAVEPPLETAAHRAGLKAGDLLKSLEWNGKKLPALPVDALLTALTDRLQARPLAGFAIEVERDGKAVRLEIAPQKREGDAQGPQIGVVPGLGTLVRSVQPGSATAAVLRPGDRLDGVNGAPVTTVHGTTVLDWWEQATGGSLVLTIRGADGTARQATVAAEEFLRWHFTGAIHWSDQSAVVGALDQDAPLARQGLRVGDRFLAVNGQPLYAPEGLADTVKGAEREVKALLEREGSPVTIALERDDLAAGRGVTWSTQLPVGAVLTDGPAARAGIEPGATITQIAGKTVRSWEDMVEELRSRKAGETLKVAWRSPRGEERAADVTLGLAPVEAAGVVTRPLEKIVRATGLESLRVGVHRTLVSAQQIFLTLRSLIRRDVSAKNLQGPLGITHVLTKVAEQREPGLLIYLLAIISINLGLFNLLPFPILDGGHLLFLGLEKIKGSPVPVKVQEWAMNVAFFLIIFLFLFVTFNDLRRLVG